MVVISKPIYPYTIERSNFLSQQVFQSLCNLILTNSRKGFISQNVLAGVNFEGDFVYLLPGWEGSAADGRVLADALSKDFVVPEGKYFLADAGVISG